jgi:hypothetical protein
MYLLDNAINLIKDFYNLCFTEIGREVIGFRHRNKCI